MTVLVSIHFEEEGQDREYQAILLAVPRAGELVSIGSPNTLQCFEVQSVLHSQIDDRSEATLFCKKLPSEAQRGGERSAADDTRTQAFGGDQAKRIV